MKLAFAGDSITDMDRDRKLDNHPRSLGGSFVFVIASKLSEIDPTKYEIINRGCSGDRIVDIYARIKKDCWNLCPDVITLFSGINDLWHGINPDWEDGGISLEIYEKMYKNTIEDTLKALPNSKIILVEPFILHGIETDKYFSKFEKIYEYADIVKKLAKEYNLPIVLLQARFNEIAKKYGGDTYLYDGVHPRIAGATIIANEWIKTFTNEVLNKQY